MIKLVLCDVDNTLVPYNEHPVCPQTLEAIDDLTRAGIRFGLATGRDVCELERIFGGADAPLQTGILSNGKKLYVDGELKRLTLIERDGMVRLASEVRDIPGTFVCVYPLHTDVRNPVWCLGAENEDVERFVKQFEFAGTLTDEVPDVPIIGATVACSASQEHFDQILDRFAQITPQFDFVQPTSHWCDILPRGLNKGTALDELLGLLDIDRDEVMVFGDADNDLSLLRGVRHSVAVANATPAVREAARWHIGACEDHAVAAALHELAHAAHTGQTPGFMRGWTRREGA
ncbi:MAG: HAD family hydrolase [Coriobacteriales bacterium]|nr:HAD family hydrolase [Coriobacteriales bacterium]